MRPAKQLVSRAGVERRAVTAAESPCCKKKKKKKSESDDPGGEARSSFICVAPGTDSGSINWYQCDEYTAVRGTP
jgi:hypothetical protein